MHDLGADAVVQERVGRQIFAKSAIQPPQPSSIRFFLMTSLNQS
jgi:hypothetical protein